MFGSDCHSEALMSASQSSLTHRSYICRLGTIEENLPNTSGHHAIELGSKLWKIIKLVDPSVKKALLDRDYFMLSSDALDSYP
jgi:hypothetical protein